MTDEQKRVVEWLKSSEPCAECFIQYSCDDWTCCKIREAAVLIEQMAAELERVKHERGAAVSLLEGHCFSCGKAEITELVPGHPLMTCDHIRTRAIASSGRSCCPHWQMKPLICSETQNQSKSTSLAPDNFIGEQPVAYGAPFDEPIGGEES